MKTYIYKIQWLFSVSNNFATNKSQLRKELYTVIRSIGARSLTVINFRDKDLNIIGNYTSMVMYGSNTSSSEAIKYIKKTLKNNVNIEYVELLRK